MSSQSEKFEPTFIPLSDVIHEIARRLPVSDEDADIRRGLNRKALNSDPLIAQLELAPIKGLLGNARAAHILLGKLNRPSTERPHWVDASSGYPLLDDSASKDGLQILVAMERYERESLPGGGGKRNDVCTEISERLAVRSKQIGFMRVDLQRLFDALEETATISANEVRSLSVAVEASNESVEGLVEGAQATADKKEVSAEKSGTCVPKSNKKGSEMTMAEAKKIISGLSHDEVVRRMSLILMESERIVISREIVEALRSAAIPTKAISVWVELVRLAKENRFTSLQWVSEDSIKAPRLQGRTALYKLPALSQCLKRTIIKVAVQVKNQAPR